MKPPWVMVVVALLLGACEREQRHLVNPLAAAPGAEAASVTPRQERVAYDVSQGKRLFRWYNCSGCHSNGGGGMGPVLGIACPTVLFPYARETISDLITRGGFPPLLLTPISFEQLYVQRLQQQQEQGANPQQQASPPQQQAG